MDGKEAASLAGLAPILRESGAWKGEFRIGGGRHQRRRALYMRALVAIRHNLPRSNACERRRHARDRDQDPT